MSDGLNRVCLMGHVGSDAELRYTQAGVAVLNWRMATSESWVDKDKVRKERVEWHTCVLFGARAAALAPILAKGALIYCEGGLRTSSYDDKDGVKRYKTEVAIREVILTGKGSGGANHDAGDHGGGPPHGEGGYSRTSAGGGSSGRANAAPAASNGGGSGGAKRGYKGPVATDAEMAEQYGDPVVKMPSRNWKGPNFEGKPYSECSPEFLEHEADWLYFKSIKPLAGKEQYVDRDLKNAALAAGWAARNRKNGGPKQSAGGGGSGGAPTDDYAGDYGGGGAGADDDIPFASCAIEHDPLVRGARRFRI